MTAHEAMKVSQAMTASVHTIDATATVKDAIQAVRAHNVSSLAVERRDEHDEFGLLVRFELSRALVVDTERKPVGIVTLRDMVLCYGVD